MDKEETVAKMMDPAGAYADGAQIVIPQYTEGSKIRDPWGWGTGLARHGHIMNPMTAYRASTQCGQPAAVVARHEEELRKVSAGVRSLRLHFLRPICAARELQSL